MLLIVPPLEAKPWPTLGPYVCDWIEKNLVHGPGDLLGKPVELDEEFRLLIYRSYEIFPSGHPKAGRRRFKRCHWSLRKGRGKTEVAAMIAAAELHPEAPVRCDGFGRRGKPIGAGMTDPYVPMVAYTEEQVEGLAYHALYWILKESRVASAFDIGLERIMRVKGDGKAEPLAAAPDARDGARTTWQHFDEVHRFVRSSRAKAAHKVMLENIPKRRKADAWSLETTTAPASGEGSVAEAAHVYAQAVADGKTSDPTFFFFHRQASEKLDITKPKELKRAVLEASGPGASWSGDLDAIQGSFSAPGADISYNRRVWLNQIVKAGGKAFDLKTWSARYRQDYAVAKGALITIGFDGARRDDSTGLVGQEVETGFMFKLGVWERPAGVLGDDWEVDEADVDATVHKAFEDYQIFRLYADPPFWETTVAKWAGEFGEERVIAWPTYRYLKMAHAVRALLNAITDDELSHDGDPDLARHVGNAHKRMVTARDDKGARMWVLQKDREGSPDKIDLAVAAVLCNQARNDALALGAKAATANTYNARAARGERVIRTFEVRR